MTGSLAPIEKCIDVAVSPERAFAHFTQEIHRWWPLATHSLGQEKTKTVVFEAIAGGRIYEIDTDGEQREWGRVMQCEPGTLLVFSWVLERPDHATEVEVRFEPVGEGHCRLTLIHRGWDRRPDGAETRASYHSGWDVVLAGYRVSAMNT